MACMVVALVQAQVTEKDVDVILGEKWTGNLVYLDYSTNKEVMIPVEIKVEKVKKGKYSLDYNYPNEPKANSTGKIAIDFEKQTLNKEVMSEFESRDGLFFITTTSTGKDNGKAATFIKRYILGETSFSIRKDVQYEGSEEVFMRNEYRMNR